MDEDAMIKDLVIALRTRNVDVFTVDEAELRGRSDEQQLRYATEQGRVIYSFNVGHYAALHTLFLQQGLHHAGILLAPNSRWSVGEQTRRIMALLDYVSAEDMQDALEYLGSWG
jgi:hypothetical protein